MAQEFDDLIAELDAAKADLARSVRRCRTFLADRQLPPVTSDQDESTNSAFSWPRGETR